MNVEEFKTRAAIGEVVPHKGKMLLLDSIQGYSFEDSTITAEVSINKASMFYDENLGGVPAWIAFEYMAQSIAALSGIYGRAKGEKPRVGFVMSITNFETEVPVFKMGETVVVRVRQKSRMDMAVTFEGTASVGGREVVTATLNTVEVQEP